MPSDTRRLNGPELSIHPNLFLKEPCPVIPTDGLRADGRQRGQVDMRPMFARCGPIPRAKGSAYIEAGNTKVICSVNGPKEIERRDDVDMQTGRLAIDMRFAPFASPVRGSWIPENQDKDFASVLEESLQSAVILNQYPRCQIEVNILVLENSGSALAHAITCASMALADAGIEMYDLALGCSIRQEGASYLADPTYEEETSFSSESSENQGNLTVAFFPCMNQISAIHSDGQMTQDNLHAVISTAIEGCCKLYPVVQDAFAKALKDVKPKAEESEEKNEK